jgi:hypothetical protein
MPVQTEAPASQSATAGFIHQLKFARNGTKKILEGIPADKMCVIPSGCSKHALWIMGHLASTDDWLLSEFAKQKSNIPEAWQKLFGMKSAASADANAHPSVDEVRKAMDAAHAGVLKWIGSLTPEQLQTPMSKEWQAYAPTMGDLAGFFAWHEGYHAGQLSMVRKGLGLPAAFG